jgi:transcription termination factor NusB
LSRQRKDEEYIVTVDLQLPKDYVHEAEIRLVNACLGELLKQVIKDTESMKE